MLSKRCISIQTLRFKRRFSHTVDASLSVSFIMARLMKQHYKQNWPHNTRLSIQLAQWPLPMGAVWLFYFKFGAVLRHGNTHTMWCSLCWPVPGQFLATNGKNISMDTSLRHRVPLPVPHWAQLQFFYCCCCCCWWKLQENILSKLKSKWKYY